ncbi:MAG: response regulator transcription factor [Phycisphaerales bacterium]
MASAKYEAVICQFSGCRDCLQRLLDMPCDVLIVDWDEAGTEARDMIVQARHMWPWQSCIALVGKGAVEPAVVAMKAGASDCLEKSTDPGPLLLAIEQGLCRAAALFPSGTSLTRTQLAVLHLILAGRTSRDIAERLGRSKRTVDVHRRNIFHKLGLRSSLEVMKWAMSTGFCGSPWRESLAEGRVREPVEDSTTPGG